MRIYLLIAAIAGGVTWLVTPLIRHVAIHIGAVGEFVRATCTPSRRRAWADWAC